MGDGWVGDLRHVLRRLRASPGFTFVAAASLAIGIGANAAMFGAVRALLMDPMPVERPQDLRLAAWRRDARMQISQNNSSDYPDPDGGQSYRSNFSSEIYEAMRAAAPPGVDLLAFHLLRALSVASGDAPALQVGGTLVDGDYFAAAGIPMAAGRPMGPGDVRPDAPLVAVLGHGLWMRAFGRDPAVVGSTVRVNGLPAEVIGVTAEGFRGMSMGGFFPQTDITLPLSAQQLVVPRAGGPLRDDPNSFWLRVMARTGAGLTDQVAESALTSAFRGQPSAANEGEGTPAEVRLLPGARGAQPLQESSARTLYLLLGAGGLVLLIACVNLAGLMLARGVVRQREMAIRRALGSGRARLVRQSFMESLVLSALGTLAGLALAFGTRQGLARLVSDTAGGEAFGHIAAESALTPGVVLVGLLIGVGATLVFGTLPALRLSSVDPMTWLKERAGGIPPLTVGRVLLSMQIAVSVPLLVGSGLLLRSLGNLDSVELGFDAQDVYTFQLNPTYGQIPREEHANLYLQVLEEVRRIPGVESASLMQHPPLGGIVSNSSIDIEGTRYMLYLNAVGPDFLRTFGMRLVEGRMPGIQDEPDAPLVAVVNERLAREVFGGGSPLGRTLPWGSRKYEVVGVVNDSRYRNTRSEVPLTVFPAALQLRNRNGYHVLVRTTLPLARLEPALRQAVGRVNRDLPVSDLTSQEARVAQSTARERLVARLITVFSTFALLLASIGLHGVVAYSVGRRTREIGIRVAVGAEPGQVRWLMLRQVIVLCAAGLAVGVPLALAGGRLLESLLFDVAATDGWTIAGASALLLTVALGAGYRPARRASAVDPLEALRAE